MKILAFSQYYYPENTGPTELCEELVKKNNEIKVITGLPNYPVGKVYKEYKFFKNRKQNINGVNIERTFEIGRKNNKIFLILNYLSFCFSASIKSLFISNVYDIVYCHQLSPILIAIPAIIYSKLKNKKMILYCLDLWPDSLKIYGIKENSIIYKISKKISKKIYNNCDKIVISSNAFEKYLTNVHNIDKNKIVYIPQYSFDFFSEENISFNEKTNLIFAGNIGKAQNVELIVKAISMIKNKEKVIVHIVGKGSNLDNIKNMVNEKELDDNFIFYGLKDKEETKKIYNECDACLLTLTSDKNIGNTIPLKLQSYMSTGKPILASANGSSRELIETTNCGKCVSAGDLEGYINIIDEFVDNKEKYISLGYNGRKYYQEHFTTEIFIDQLTSLMKGILGENDV